MVLHHQAEDSRYRYLRKDVSEVLAITSSNLLFCVYPRRSLAVFTSFERRTRKDFRNLNRAEVMAESVTNGTSYSTKTTTMISLAKAFTEVISNTTSTTSHRTAASTASVIAYETVITKVLVEAPLTCKNIDLYASTCSDNNFLCWVSIADPKPNPDIAGIGVCIPYPTCFSDDADGAKILLAFFITACAVLILALVAYTGGFLPAHFLRRIDRRIFRAKSRREHSPWRTVIENVMLALSDQQLVTGFALLVAGYYEMMNNDLSIYYWQIVVYLAWLSSSVHIASLTILRDVLSKSPRLRNIRVAGMVALLILLIAAMWPTRFEDGLYYPGVPSKCYWKSRQVVLENIDPNWVFSMAAVLFAYVWKLSQLFATSRGLVRRCLVAKPEAILERLMRHVATSHWPRWVSWPINRALLLCYITFVAYAELAESFIASIIYIGLVLPYGISTIVNTRLWYGSYGMADDADEMRLTFGQLVPLFMLVLPILSVIELYPGK